jgi:NAD(P)-dependent dehydrogenase (short-subunit alcohol dehydrogenase family)
MVTGSMQTPSSFDGRVAIVTGGTQGLGEATARLMAERGAAGLVIVGRNTERGEAVAADISASGCRTVFVEAELADLDRCRAVLTATEAEFGTVHALASVAAITDRGSVWNTTPEMWDRMMAVNLRAPFFLLQGAADLMQRTGVAGSIVTVGSVAGEGGAPNLLPYSVSKGALQAMTKNAAFSLARHRIRVNLLQLGWMNTPAEHSIQVEQEGKPEDWLVHAAAAQPFGRLIETDEAARAICYLASDESGLMTGATIDFDQSIIGAGQQPVPGPEVVR